jgi:hypothetical protein
MHIFYIFINIRSFLIPCELLALILCHLYCLHITWFCMITTFGDHFNVEKLSVCIEIAFRLETVVSCGGCERSIGLRRNALISTNTVYYSPGLDVAQAMSNKSDL